MSAAISAVSNPHIKKRGRRDIRARPRSIDSDVGSLLPTSG